MKNIPEDLSNKIKTPLQTPANNADPKMSITVVRAKTQLWITLIGLPRLLGRGWIWAMYQSPQTFTLYGSPNRIL